MAFSFGWFIDGSRTRSRVVFGSHEHRVLKSGFNLFDENGKVKGPGPLQLHGKQRVVAFWNAWPPPPRTGTTKKRPQRMKKRGIRLQAKGFRGKGDDEAEKTPEIAPDHKMMIKNSSYDFSAASAFEKPRPGPPRPGVAQGSRLFRNPIIQIDFHFLEIDQDF